MKPVELLGQTLSPRGSVIKLVRRDEEYLLLADDAILMGSRMHGSEDALATLGCARARMVQRPSVLIGGLGMGFTLRATLDLLPQTATVVVAELLPAVVEWNRGPLAPLAGYPLQDQRVRVVAENVLATLRSQVDQFDAVLLDVDNGPAALTTPDNDGLYDQRGIVTAYAALKDQGVLAVWATRDDRSYVQRLRDAHFEVEVQHPRARLKKAGRHTIFLSRKS